MRVNLGRCMRPPFFDRKKSNTETPFAEDIVFRKGRFSWSSVRISGVRPNGVKQLLNG